LESVQPNAEDHVRPSGEANRGAEERNTGKRP